MKNEAKNVEFFIYLKKRLRKDFLLDGSWFVCSWIMQKCKKPHSYIILVSNLVWDSSAGYRVACTRLKTILPFTFMYRRWHVGQAFKDTIFSPLTFFFRRSNLTSRPRWQELTTWRRKDSLWTPQMSELWWKCITSFIPTLLTSWKRTKSNKS